MVIRQQEATDGDVSLTLVEMIASLEGREIHETDFTLHEYLEGEALDRLLASGNTDLSVQFTIEEYQVSVSGDGTVTVTDEPESCPESPTGGNECSQQSS